MTLPGNIIRNLTWILLPGLLLYCFSSCVTESEPKGADLQAGDRLPVFSVTLSDGTIISSQSLKGKCSVIVFFNTSCPDCQKELPVVQNLWKEVKEQSDISLFAIAREELSESIENYWESHNFTIPWSAQSDRKIYNLFATSRIPRVYISDRDEIIRFVFDDSDMPDLFILKEAINSVLKD